MSWYLGVLKKYAMFEGRARRKEYWMFALINLIIGIVLAAMEGLLGIFPDFESSVFVAIYSLAIFLPYLAVSVRRLHDTNRSGWWFLICLVPIANIILIVYLVQDSYSGTNTYGPNPKNQGVEMSV